MLDLNPLEGCTLNVHLADSSKKKPLCRVDDVLIVVNDNYWFYCYGYWVQCFLSYYFGRPFLRTVGAIIDMKEGNIKFQFPP